MATFSEFTNQGIPSEGNHGPFPTFGNVGAPYMETLSLPGLTTSLHIWLFSTSVVLNIQTASQPSSPPPEPCQTHVDPKVDPSPSLPISSPCYSSFLGESLDSSNWVIKKKKKSKKKKENKLGGKSATIATHVAIVEKPPTQIGRAHV